MASCAVSISWASPVRQRVLQARRHPCRTLLRPPVRALSHAASRRELARRFLQPVWSFGPRGGSTCVPRCGEDPFHSPQTKERTMAAEEREDRDLNRDPITDEPGAHPIGTGVGATGGAVAGAAAGSIAGPVGAAIGGAVGAVVGGLAGKAAGEAVNPTAEEAFWRDNYNKEPYYEQGRSFDDYGPAYRLGLSGRERYEQDQ